MNTPGEQYDDLPLEPAAPAPGRRHRRAAAIAMTAGLLGGGAIGLVATVPGFSSAATPEPATTTATVDDTATDDTAADDTATDDTATDDTATDDGSVVIADAPEGGDVPVDAPAPPEGYEPGTGLREALQPLVDDGTITADQLEAVVDQLVASRPARGEGPFGGRGGGRHGGFGMGGGQLAELLGIDTDTLRAELAEGSTIAAIAEANGVDVQTVIDGLIAPVQEHLAEAVANGRLTQEQADEWLAKTTQGITDMVNNGWQMRGPGGRGHHRGMDDATADATADA